MGNRPIKRRVVIVFESRDPNDSAGLLRAVADELRPREVEIRVKSPSPGVDPPTHPDEQLEPRARDHAAQVLDRRDREVQAAPKEASSAPADPARDLATKRQRVLAWLGRRVASTKRQRVLATKRQRVLAWLGQLIARGWRFSVDVVLPVGERVAKIYKDVHG